MQEDLLFFFRSLDSIKFVGEKFLAGLVRLLPGVKFKDILFHFPVDVIDRTYSPLIKDAIVGKIATLKVEVLSHKSPPYVRGRKIPYKVVCSDGTGIITINFFNFGDYLKKQLPIGARVCISGKIERFAGEVCMSHCDYITPVSEFDKVAVLEPVYPLTYGITNKMLRSVISKILEDMPLVPEWVSGAEVSFVDAIRIMHNPSMPVGLQNIAKERLAYDEVLANQLSLGLSRTKFKLQKGVKIQTNGVLRSALISSLDYTLTKAQERVILEILTDMKSDFRMLRLLQGDVGSGKTIVSLLALLEVVEAGGQGAFMVPTEILANQHLETLTGLLEKAGISDKVRVVILTGSDKGKVRTQKLGIIKNGEVDIVIGTHALFQKDVEFKNLWLAVIDEQHKFGVNQRLELTQKGGGDKVNIITMTATPIPRTLAMISFGDMDLSVIDEMPPNRKEIATYVMNMSKIEDMVASIHLKFQTDEIKKLYWVCPLVEESEKLDLTAVMMRYEHLNAEFGDRVALVHGKMKADDKNKAMVDFASSSGKAKILLATTVIEVGVNVPEATLMIIEHSERFGLSSLHQLRGRIGRGGDKSVCVLFHGDRLTHTAKARLAICRETTDGFKIADEDLRLRGSGDVLGVRQSGQLEFRIADLAENADLIFAAMRDVKNILASDDELKSSRGLGLRFLLSLFEYKEQIKCMSAG